MIYRSWDILNSISAQNLQDSLKRYLLLVQHRLLSDSPLRYKKHILLCFVSNEWYIAVSLFVEIQLRSLVEILSIHLHMWSGYLLVLLHLILNIKKFIHVYNYSCSTYILVYSPFKFWSSTSFTFHASSLYLYSFLLLHIFG
mgnify:CR=1 FL=1